MNRLSGERSPYLRHAAHQKIDWFPWSEEAFERAREQNRPVFLSSGAVWCHWCHVMARESFEDPEIAAILNDHFISVKLDRDERPDIDRRYQNAVAAMGFGSGWPLTVFLTPEKKPFFGGTYFPPDDRFGRPGFKKVLRAVIEYYATRRELIDDYAEKLTEALVQRTFGPGSIRPDMLHSATETMVSQADAVHGGFGSAPKFPMPGALQFLLSRYILEGDDPAGSVVKKSLEAMALGGFHDQLGGGFHRYSVDEAWVVPHFEKMADDNGWLLRTYLDGYRVFGTTFFREVAEGIIRFLKDDLSAPQGGFFASQDADVTPDDEGGYFTWKEDEFKGVLTPEEYDVLSLHFLGERGAMHHDPGKRVLFVARGTVDIARHLGIDPRRVIALIESGKEKLLAARRARESPFIDGTIYTSVNGLLIASFLKASGVLEDPRLGEFALKSLKRVLAEHYVEGVLYRTERVHAILDDYVFLTEALIDAYGMTGDDSFLSLAVTIMDSCIEKFWDSREGGFFDTDSDVIGMRLKTIEDTPHPSANGVAIHVLLTLHAASGERRYKQYAETSLELFAGQAEAMGIHAGSYFRALDAYFHMVTLTVQTAPNNPLAEAARSVLYPYVSYRYEAERGCVIPCLGDVCYDPLKNAEEVRKFFAARRKIGT